MSIYIYNSLSRKKEEFIPLNPPKVNIYTCGVTVYDHSHIGHARSLYIFEIIRRYLQYRGFKVNFVRNITDIDDKIINRANELKINWQELVDKYIAGYIQDLKSLNLSEADSQPRATENISEMVGYIKSLIDKGYAYEAGGDVYFNVRKFNAYGKLSGQSVDQMQEAVRIEPSGLKKDPLDFALWKRSKENEPAWDSPWGGGRPGWHIECSVMSQKFLRTETLDIHAGGRDLIFPHHENEIAQAEALTGKPFAKYWIHHGLLTINGQKMAKSMGNFVTIKDFISRYHDADILKLFFLSAHYSHPIDYTDERMDEARAALERIMILSGKMDEGSRHKAEGSRHKKIKEIEEIKDKFIQAMDDDFNMPQGLATIFELVNIANKNIQDLDFIAAAQGILKELLGIFGISLHKADSVIEAIEERVSEKILERNRARKNKDFALADRIRKELEEEGLILEDVKDGKTTWRRKL